MLVQNITTKTENKRQYTFKSCIKYKQNPEKLSANTLALIEAVHTCNKHFKQNQAEPLYFLGNYIPKILEGIQEGISIFKNLNMTEISFFLSRITEIGILRGCFNNCAHCYANGSPPLKESADTVSRMSWDDYKSLTEGIEEINDRLDCTTRLRPVPMLLFHDSDCSQIYIKDNDGKTHGWTELAKMMYSATKNSIIFSTAGWYKEDVAAQQRMEQYVEEMSNADNLDYLYHFAISANPYQAMHYKAVQLMKKGDKTNEEKIRQKDNKRMANVLFTITPMLKTGKVKFITRAMSPESKNSEGLSTNDLVETWNNYFEELKKMYELDYATNKKIIKKRSDIESYLTQYKTLLYKKGINTEPAVTERLSKIYSQDDPATIFTDTFKFKDPKKATTSAMYDGIVDANGKFYLTNFRETYPTELELNFENSHKKTAPIGPFLNPEPITKEMINDLESCNQAYFQ